MSDEVVDDNQATRSDPRHEAFARGFNRSLRDQFAAAALQGILSGVTPGIVSTQEGMHPFLPGYVEAARWAYGYAEAMMAERAAVVLDEDVSRALAVEERARQE